MAWSKVVQSADLLKGWREIAQMPMHLTPNAV